MNSYSQQRDRGPACKHLQAQPQAAERSDLEGETSASGKSAKDRSYCKQQSRFTAIRVAFSLQAGNCPRDRMSLCEPCKHINPGIRLEQVVTPRPLCFWETDPATNWKAGLVGPRAGVEALGMRLVVCAESITMIPSDSVSSLVSLYQLSYPVSAHVFVLW